MAKNGELYQKINDKLRKRRWCTSQMSKWEVDKYNDVRYTWEFRGHFRWDRMLLAVRDFKKNYKKYGFEKHTRDYILEVFRKFNPAADMTEYGPHQFPDYLDSIADVSEDFEEDIRKVSNCLRDIYSTNNVDEWKPFDNFTNASIEIDRQNGRPISLFQAGDYVYALLFDSGAGASGAPPVVLRPGRYERFLTSIEEQFARSSFDELFHILRDQSIDPTTFLVRTVSSDSYQEVVQEMCPECIHDRVNEIMERLNSPNASVSARIQNFLPALLDKFNECEVRLSARSHTSKVFLDPLVQETIHTGLKSTKHDFEDLVKFIYETRS